jgi:drug/metabolite transporter (DMT)-like permease
MSAWTALAFLGVFGTGVAFVWFYEGVRRLGTARTAVFVNLVPVFAIAFGVLLLGETLEPSMVVGGLVVVGGVWLINRNPPAAPLPATAS